MDAFPFERYCRWRRPAVAVTPRRKSVNRVQVEPAKFKKKDVANSLHLASLDGVVSVPDCCLGHGGG